MKTIKGKIGDEEEREIELVFWKRKDRGNKISNMNLCLDSIIMKISGDKTYHYHFTSKVVCRVM